MRTTPVDKARSVLSNVESGEVTVTKMRQAVKSFMNSYPGSLSKSVGAAVSNFRRNVSSGKVPAEEKALVTDVLKTFDTALANFIDHAKHGQSWTQPVMVSEVNRILANASALEGVVREVQSKWVAYKARRSASQKSAQTASRAVDREKEKLTAGYRNRGVYHNFCCFLQNCGFVRTAHDKEIAEYEPTCGPQDSEHKGIDWTVPHWFHNEENEEGGPC